MSDGRVQIDAILDDSDVTSGVARIKASLKSIKGADSAVDFSGIKSAGKALTGIGKTLSIGVTAPMAALGKSIVGTSVNFLSLRQDAHVAFTTMMGSADAASQMLQRLYTFAKTTPFSYDSILQASRSLVAMGMSAEDVVPTLRAVGDAAASSGKGQAAFAAITDTLGKMSAQSNVSLDDMWSLSDNGVQALQILANKSGVSVEEMRKRISNGAVGSKWAIDALVDGIEHGSDGVAGATAKMGGQMGSLKQTWTGATDTMRSAWRNLALAAMGESDNVASSSSKVLDSLVPMVHGVTELLNTTASKLREAGVSVTPIIDKVTELLGKLNDKIASMSPEQVRAVAKALMLFAAAGPVLTVAGKAVEKVGSALEKVGKMRETVSRVKETLSGMRKAADDASSAGEALSNAMGSASDSNRIYANSANDAALKTYMAEQAQKAFEEANSAATASVEKGAEAAKGAGSITAAAASMATGAATTLGAALATLVITGLYQWNTRTRALSDSNTTLAGTAAMLAGSMGRVGDAASSTGTSMKALNVDLDASASRSMQLAQSIQSTADGFAGSTAALAQHIAKIEELTSKSELSATEQDALRAAVAGYNSITGESVEVTDALHGTLSASADELRDNASAWREAAAAAAQAEMMNQIMTEQAKTQQELTTAYGDLTRAQEDYAEAVKSGNEGEIRRAGEVLTKAQEAVDGLKGKLDSLNDSMKATESWGAQFSGTLDAETASAAAAAAGLDEMAQKLAGLTAGSSELTGVLSDNGISVVTFAAALEQAGVTADNWSQSGDAIISTLESMGVQLSDTQKEMLGFNSTELEDKEATAEVDSVSVEEATGDLKEYDGTPILDKSGNAVVASETVVDAQGNIMKYDGTPLYYKDARANVNSHTVVDAKGNIIRYNNTRMNSKNANATVHHSLPSVIGHIDAYNGRRLQNKSATITTTIINRTVNIVESIGSSIFGHAKGGVLVPRHARGGIIHPLATGGIVHRPTLLNLVGEDGAEAVFPLTNKRYSSVFAGTLAEELMKVLGRMPGTGSGIDWNASTGMHQSAQALGIAADKLGTIGDALSANDAYARGDTGGSMSMQAMTDLISGMDRQVINIYLNDVQVNSDEDMRRATREYVEMLYRKAVGNVG